MKNLLFFLVIMLLTPILVQAQDETSYQMFELIYLKPKMGQQSALMDHIASHNKKFHTDGPYQVYVATVLTGKHGGSISLAMGPGTWTQLDDRPNGEDHQMDNAKMSPMLDKVSPREYWTIMEKQSYIAGPPLLEKSRLWFIDIASGETYRFNALMEKIAGVAKDQAYPTSMITYDNALATDSGRDKAIAWYFTDWAWFDEDPRMKSDYESKYGEGSWDNMLEEWEEVVVSMDEQLSVFNKDASTGGGTN